MAGLDFMQQGTHLQVVGSENPSKKAKDIDDRFKKGEWSDGAINALLDAYESKWNMRNRGNLRVGDWDEVAKYVSYRGDSRKSAKTPSQCKNKIEGMKKKYRSEALESCNSRTGCSGWPFFCRMDSLLRCPTRMAGIPGGLDAGGLPVVADLGFQDAVPQMDSGDSEQPGLRTEALFSPDANPRKDIPFSHLQLFQGNHGLQGQAFFREEEEEQGVQDVESNHADASNTIPNIKESGTPDSGTSGPGNKSVRVHGINSNPTAKQRRQINNEVAASIRTFADSILKLEHAKMEMYKDTERLRAEAEAKRAELELKRTEMIMNTQLQIAKLLSKNTRKRKKADEALTAQTRKAEGAALAQFKNRYMQGSGQLETSTFQESPANEY